MITLRQIEVIRAVMVTGTIVGATVSAKGSILRTTDGGASWQAKTETLGSLSVGAVAMDPNNPETLYLGLGDPFDGTGLGMVKMTAGGDKWEAPVFLGNSTSIRDILVAPGNSNIVLVATDQGLYRSTDAGKTYAPVAINTGAVRRSSRGTAALAGRETTWTIWRRVSGNARLR